MDLLALRYFQVVARLEHVGRAAERLHVAQPSLSRTLARLESDLGVPLFDRHGRRIRLNRFGAAFLRRVDRILAELEDGRQELADAAGLDRGSVAVAAETLLTLTELLREFVAAHPLVDIRLFQSSAPGMAEQLRTGEVDLCVASQPLPGEDLRTLELMTDPVMLCVPADHHLATQDQVSVRELSGEPFITTRPGYWQRTLAEHLFNRAGAELRIACEGDEPGATGDLIGAGLGVGLVPGIARLVDTRPSLVWLPVAAPDCHRTLTLVWREDAYLSAAAHHFGEHAAAHFRELRDSLP